MIILGAVRGYRSIARLGSSLAEEETKLGNVQSHGKMRARTTYRSTDINGMKTMEKRCVRERTR